jgi:hypothetical protein
MHGFGPFRRDGDNVVCDDPAKEGSEPADACRKGLVAALTRKAKHNSQVAARLLVYARRYSDEVGDDFAAIVAEAMREFERASGAVAHFEVIYFVNTSALVEA